MQYDVSTLGFCSASRIARSNSNDRKYKSGIPPPKIALGGGARTPARSSPRTQKSRQSLMPATYLDGALMFDRMYSVKAAVSAADVLMCRILIACGLLPSSFASCSRRAEREAIVGRPPAPNAIDPA